MSAVQVIKPEPKKKRKPRSLKRLLRWRSLRVILMLLVVLVALLNLRDGQKSTWKIAEPCFGGAFTVLVKSALTFELDRPPVPGLKLGGDAPKTIGLSLILDCYNDAALLTAATADEAAQWLAGAASLTRLGTRLETASAAVAASAAQFEPGRVAGVELYFAIPRGQRDKLLLHIAGSRRILTVDVPEDTRAAAPSAPWGWPEAPAEATPARSILGNSLTATAVSDASLPVDAETRRWIPQGARVLCTQTITNARGQSWTRIAASVQDLDAAARFYTALLPAAFRDVRGSGQRFFGAAQGREYVVELQRGAFTRFALMGMDVDDSPVRHLSGATAGPAGEIVAADPTVPGDMLSVSVSIRDAGYLNVFWSGMPAMGSLESILLRESIPEPRLEAPAGDVLFLEFTFVLDGAEAAETFAGAASKRLRLAGFGAHMHPRAAIREDARVRVYFRLTERVDNEAVALVEDGAATVQVELP